MNFIELTKAGTICRVILNENAISALVEASNKPGGPTFIYLSGGGLLHVEESLAEISDRMTMNAQFRLKPLGGGE